ncbi:MAG: MarR family winged helix-turn-helix transcriptional regulator [Pikeienuella sp.]
MQKRGTPPLAFNSVVFRIAITNNALTNASALMAKKEGDIGLTDWRIIAILGRSNIKTASDIVANTRFDAALISRSVASLAKRGLVEILPDPKDKRAKQLRLTDAGRKMAKITEMAIKNYVAQLEAGLTEEEISVLHSALGKIEDAAMDIYNNYKPMTDF